MESSKGCARGQVSQSWESRTLTGRRDETQGGEGWRVGPGWTRQGKQRRGPWALWASVTTPARIEGSPGDGRGARVPSSG